MNHAIVNSEPIVLEIRDADATLAGLPIRGTYGGGGIHAPVSDIPGEGWCRWAFQHIKHPIVPQWAYPIVEARALPLKSQVPAHAAAIDARGELPPGWFVDPGPPSGATKANDGRIR